MPAALPHRVLGLVVAGQARVADLARGHLAELQDVALRIVVDVRLAGAVARLAALLGCGRARNLGVAVGGAVDGGGLVARQAGVLSDIPAWGLCGGGGRPLRGGGLPAARRGRPLPAGRESPRPEHGQAERECGGHRGRGGELTEHSVAVHNNSLDEMED